MSVGASPRVVPVLDRCSKVTASLATALADTPYELVPVPSWGQIQALGSSVVMYIATAAASEVLRSDREVLTSRMKRDGLPVVMVYGGMGPAPGPAGQDDLDLRSVRPKSPTVRGPFNIEHVSVLPVAVGECWWMGRVRQMTRRVDAGPLLSLPTRAAIKWTLHLWIPEITARAQALQAEPDRKRRHLWATSVAAAATGISRGHLMRKALEDQWRIRSGADKWIAVQAVYRSELYDEGLPGLALRLGYADESGLTRLLERTLGHPPSVLPTWDGEYWLRWFEEEVLTPVVEQGRE